MFVFHIVHCEKEYTCTETRLTHSLAGTYFSPILTKILKRSSFNRCDSVSVENDSDFVYIYKRHLFSNGIVDWFLCAISSKNESEKRKNNLRRSLTSALHSNKFFY